MDGGSSALALEWQQTPEANDEVLLRAVGWTTRFGESAVPLSLALLHSRIKRITWADRGPSAFWIISPVPHAATLARYLGADDDDGFADALVAGLQEAMRDATGKAPEWGTITPEIRVIPVSEAVRAQAALFPGRSLVEHNGLRFRSFTEARLARALDEMKVMYFPLPVAIRGSARKEPDFLIVHRGQVGVLEVDGPHHTAMTRADEDRRAMWFYQSGVSRVHHFSVKEIDADAKGVVLRFLQLLRGPVA